MSCKICETRRPRRCCPGVRGDICSMCCGTEREVTVDCPLDCEFLQEARRRQRIPPPPADPPNGDIRVTESFLREHEPLLLALGRTLVDGALSISGAVDADVREALEALIRTYRTLESGLYYETRPDNPMAARLCQLVQAGVAQRRQAEQQQFGIARTRDAELLGVLVFLQRTELMRNNGRKRGRAFLHFLADNFLEPEPVAGSASLLLVP